MYLLRRGFGLPVCGACRRSVRKTVRAPPPADGFRRPDGVRRRATHALGRKRARAPARALRGLAAGYTLTAVDAEFASGDYELAVNTTYVVVFQISGSSGTYNLRVTDQNGEDSGAASGRSIADNHYWRNQDANDWSTDADALKIAVIGSAVSTATNSAATGAPTIFGSAQVSEPAVQFVNFSSGTHRKV